MQPVLVEQLLAFEPAFAQAFGPHLSEWVASHAQGGASISGGRGA